MTQSYAQNGPVSGITSRNIVGGPLGPSHKQLSENVTSVVKPFRDVKLPFALACTLQALLLPPVSCTHVVASSNGEPGTPGMMSTTLPASRGPFTHSSTHTYTHDSTSINLVETCDAGTLKVLIALIICGVMTK